MRTVMDKDNKKLSAPMIQVGASKETVAEVRESILAIVNVRADREVLIAALKAIEAAATTQNIHFTNNHLGA